MSVHGVRVMSGIDEALEHRRFVRTVLVGGLGAVVLITIALGAFQRRIAVAEVLEAAEHRNVRFAHVLMGALALHAQVAQEAAPTDVVFAMRNAGGGEHDDADHPQHDDRPDYEGDVQWRAVAAHVGAALNAAMSGFAIYGRDGRVIVSSHADRAAAGADTDGGTTPVLEAVRTGRLHSVLASREAKPGASVAGETTSTVTTYVPAPSDSAFAGAIVAVQDDVTPWMDALDHSRRALMLGVLGALVGLYGVLVLGVRWGDGVVRRTAARRRHAEQRRQRLERELWQRQRLQAVGTLAAGVAHEFNNVLWAIQACSEMALREMRTDDPAREKVEEIAVAAHEGMDLVRQMVSVGRRDGGERQPVEVRAAVAEVVSRIAATLPAEVELRPRLTDCGAIVAAPGEIQQLAGNLLRNAVQALQGGAGVVEVVLAAGPRDEGPRESSETGAASRDGVGHWVRLTVRDSGCGMDAATVDHAFEPFFSTKQPGEGVGLGLAIVHAIVSELGGTIEIDSAPGRGTCFEVLLPGQHPHAMEGRGAVVLPLPV